MVKPTVNNNVVIKEERAEDEVSKVSEKINMKRKHFEDKNKDADELTLLNGLSVPKDGSVSAFKKYKKIATTEKMLKLEQEKV